MGQYTKGLLKLFLNAHDLTQMPLAYVLQKVDSDIPAMCHISFFFSHQIKIFSSLKLQFEALHQHPPRKLNLIVLTSFNYFMANLIVLTRVSSDEDLPGVMANMAF
ncbi:hypothetical protein ACJX0J_026005 [Zea mays]